MSTSSVKIKDRFQIFLVTVEFSQPVHEIGMGLGMTESVYRYAFARNHHEAERRVAQRFETPDFPAIKRLDARTARCQDAHAYSHAHTFAGYKAASEQPAAS